MATKKNTKQQYKNIIKTFDHGGLTHELRELIDLAVRKQLTTQDVLERLVNTHYFRNQFPGLMEHDGTIANALTGEQGVGIGTSSLAGAIKNYRSSLNQDQQIAQKYGYQFNKNQLAKLIADQTSPDEFGARLQAVEAVDANPALKAAYEQQQKALGIKVNAHSAYQAALKMGDKQFTDLYEGAQYQTQLGFNPNEANALAKDNAIPVGTSFDDISKLVSEVRNNLGSYGPELATQGITASKLVKILGNPSAFAPEIDKIKELAEQRQQRFGQPVVGSYGQQGQAGLSQYPAQREQSYG